MIEFRQKNMFNQDKDKLLHCIIDYSDFYEKMGQVAGDNKTINNFLCELPEGSHQILELNDLERL